MYTTIGVFIFFISFYTTNCMVCYPEHPQASYCRSDFVIRGKIIYDKNENGTITLSEKLSQNLVDINGIPKTHVINVYIVKVYKGGELLNATKRDTIKVDIQNPWSHKLVDSGNYLITGYVYRTKPQITMCNWVAKWQTITTVQRWGLKKYYAANCICRTKFCHVDDECAKNGKTEENKTGCRWLVSSREIGTSKSDCKSRISICMHISKYNGCTWFTPRLHCKEPDNLPLP